MTGKIALWIAVLVLALARVAAEPESAEEGAFLVFRSLSQVQGDEYRLGDIAEIRAPEKQKREWAALVLGRSPSLGYKSPLQSRVIEHKLAQSGIGGDEINLVFPEKMELERATQRVDMRELRGWIEAQARAQLPFEPTDVLIENIYVPTGIMLPSGKIERSISFRMPRRNVGNAVFTIDFVVDGVRARTVGGSLKIDIKLRVLRLETPVARGDQVASGDPLAKEGRLSKVQGQPLQNADMNTGLTARRPLALGETLTRQNTQKELLVQRNQAVRMILKNDGGMRISTVGKALSNGSLGDSIALTNLSSGKRVQGRVVGEQLVEVGY
jgi:flagella basal body P-ring formation protein FlgA